MARTPKKKVEGRNARACPFSTTRSRSTHADDEDLPKDEAGRAKIKQQYVDLLGIRIKKKRGNILNRERINKTLEGIYFICARCEKVCHNLDEGLGRRRQEREQSLRGLRESVASAAESDRRREGRRPKEKSEGAGAKAKAAKSGPQRPLVLGRESRARRRTKKRESLRETRFQDRPRETRRRAA